MQINAIRVALVFVLGVSSVNAQEAVREGPPITAFENVRVLPMTGEAPLDRRTVIVEGDRILSVVNAGDSVPAAATTIDGTGLTMLPGLADMHVHYVHTAYPDAIPGALFLFNGVSTVRQTWGDRYALERDALTKSGRVTGPHIYPSGPLMDGPDPIQAGALVVSSPGEARIAVATQAAVGFRAVKLYETMDAETYRAAVNAAHAFGLQVWTHTPGAMELADLLALGVDSIEHLDDAHVRALVRDADAREFPPGSEHGWDRIDGERLREVASQMAESGVWSIPTLTLYTQRALPDLTAFLERDEVSYLGPMVIASWRASGPPPGMSAEEAIRTHTTGARRA